MNEVLEFIGRRFPRSNDCNWLDGNCYWFARILCMRFPYLELYYNPIKGHFYAGDGTNMYDWNGLTRDNEVFSFSWIRENDSTWYERLVRDCVR
jgi:hypothetical protein